MEEKTKKSEEGMNQILPLSIIIHEKLKKLNYMK